MTWSKTPKRLIHRDISPIISIEEGKVWFKLFIIHIVESSGSQTSWSEFFRVLLWVMSTNITLFEIKTKT